MPIVKHSDGRLTVHGFGSPQDLAAVLDRLEFVAGYLDLTVDLARPRALLRRCGTLARRCRTLAEGTVGDLADLLADSDDALVEAAALASAGAQLADPDGALSRAVERAEKQRLRAAVRAARSAIDPDATFAHARTVALDAVEAIRGLRSTLDGIHTPDDATRNGPATATAWATWQAQLARWDAAHEAAALLRSARWIDRPDDRTDHDALTWGRPDVRAEQTIASGRKWRDGARVRLLLDDGCDDWQPGLYTATEAAQHTQAIEKAHADAARADAEQVGWRIDA